MLNQRPDRWIVWLFRLTILTGAFLLFLVQPMYARRLLPPLGGTPAVWNTAMVFFQSALLLGYAYAHLLIRRTNVRTGVGIHIGLLIAAGVLPILTVPGTTPVGTGDSILWVLRTLAIGIGLAFVLVSATSPLLQAWFARMDHRLSGNPYFLYSASNIGSFVALWSYPIGIERWLSTDSQIVLWRVGYGVLVAGMVLCGGLVVRRSNDEPSSSTVVNGATSSATDFTPKDSSPRPLRGDSPSWRRRGLWLVCSAAASSWLLSVTQYLTTDLAPVPLLWIIPLSIYLLSFVIVFADRPIVSPRIFDAAMPGALIVLAASSLFHGTWPSLLIHLAAFSVGVMVCHGRLASTRPAAESLTQFYLWISVGGVVGGGLNAIVAPLVFPVIIEYGLAVAVAGLVTAARRFQTDRPHDAPERTSSLVNLRDPVSLAMMVLTLMSLITMSTTMRFSGTPMLAYAGLIAVPTMMAVWLLDMVRPIGVLCGGVLILAQFQPPIAGVTRRTLRSYHGVHRIVEAPRLRQMRMLHGRTVHGIQNRVEPTTPLAYYARSGPLGRVFASLRPDQNCVGVVGLGGGAVAAYAGDTDPPRSITFFEIDPAVVRLATDDRYLTYLRDAGIEASDIVVGDGRASLATIDTPFDLLIVDAFSSDAVPMHLLTREAMAVYAAATTDDGMIAMHISNQHLDLGRVLSGLAADAGWFAYRVRSNPTPDQIHRGIAPADYVVMSRSYSRLTRMADRDSLNDWQRIDNHLDPVWTDDFHRFLDVLDWRWTRDR